MSDAPAPTSPTPKSPGNPFTRRADESRSVSELTAALSMDDDSAVMEGDGSRLPPLRESPLPSLGSAQGAGSGMSVGNEHSAGTAPAPDGVPLRPSLHPAGGSQRAVAIDGMDDANKAYGDDRFQPVHRSSDPKSQGVMARTRGIVRTYSMVSDSRGGPTWLNFEHRENGRTCPARTSPECCLQVTRPDPARVGR